MGRRYGKYKSESRKLQDAGGYYRKFNGKKYHLFSTHGKKSRAKEVASGLRNKGGKARIIKNGSKWDVFWRK